MLIQSWGHKFFAGVVISSQVLGSSKIFRKAESKCYVVTTEIKITGIIQSYIKRPTLIIYETDRLLCHIFSSSAIK